MSTSIQGASGESTGIPAGNFSEWLRGAETSLRSGEHAAAVPCGTCTACCRSSMFIHIQPEETRTIQRIPRALLFQAPGRPKGHVVMGYNDQGHCPMLVDNKCSIYQDRPWTCRTYDCRLFAATGLQVDPQTQPDIAQRVRAWAFQYESKESLNEHRAVKAAAAFLQKNGHLFPQGSLPSQPAQLAALALRIWRLFSDTAAKSSHAAMVDAVMTAMNEPKTLSE